MFCHITPTLVEQHGTHTVIPATKNENRRGMGCSTTGTKITDIPQQCTSLTSNGGTRKATIWKIFREKKSLG